MAQYIVKLASDGVILNPEKTGVTEVNVTVGLNSGTMANPTIAPASGLSQNLFDVQLLPSDSQNNISVVESKSSIGTYSITFSKPLIPGDTNVMVSIKSPTPSSKLYIDFKAMVNNEGKTTIDLPPLTSSGEYLFNTDKINGHPFAFTKDQEVTLSSAPTIADSSISAKLVDSTKPYLTPVLWPDSSANLSVELTLKNSPTSPVSGNFEISLSENPLIITPSTKAN